MGPGGFASRKEFLETCTERAAWEAAKGVRAFRENAGSSSSVQLHLFGAALSLYLTHCSTLKSSKWKVFSTSKAISWSYWGAHKNPLRQTEEGLLLPFLWGRKQEKRKFKWLAQSAQCSQGGTRSCPQARYSQVSVLPHPLNSVNMHQWGTTEHRHMWKNTRYLSLRR